LKAQTFHWKLNKASSKTLKNLTHKILKKRQLKASTESSRAFTAAILKRWSNVEFKAFLSTVIISQSFLENTKNSFCYSQFEKKHFWGFQSSQEAFSSNIL
jgi:hypothetical protein